jgi:hypothetical protein
MRSRVLPYTYLPIQYLHVDVTDQHHKSSQNDGDFHPVSKRQYILPVAQIKYLKVFWPITFIPSSSPLAQYTTYKHFTQLHNTILAQATIFFSQIITNVSSLLSQFLSLALPSVYFLYSSQTDFFSKLNQIMPQLCWKFSVVSSKLKPVFSVDCIALHRLNWPLVIFASSLLLSPCCR